MGLFQFNRLVWSIQKRRRQHLQASKMTEKVSSVTWARRRSVGPTMVPHMICVEKDGDANTKPIVGTMADSLGSLLTSMKLFGLYFKRGADAGDQSETRSNVYMIYSAVVLIITWVDVVRMFSVFKNTLRRSWRVCGVLVTVLRSCVSTSSSRCSQDKMSLEQFSSSSSVTFKTRIKGSFCIGLDAFFFKLQILRCFASS